ncbi:hypothetical protein [Mycobacterium intracellulare]|uniref:hypothetical protein n=1 Tax=Mycobacterium intracellulare TaxID=1767 RepID=UPI0009500A4C|nr:hypothetical protein [Mycobacterium intracellulare]
MTLIQTLITDDLIIQVADRRLTNAATGMLVDDQYTKLVCWNFNFSIGFTCPLSFYLRQVRASDLRCLRSNGDPVAGGLSSDLR